MPQKRFTPKESINKLCHAEVLLGQGKKVVEVTDSRWRQAFGGMPTAQAKRLKELDWF